MGKPQKIHTFHTQLFTHFHLQTLLKTVAILIPFLSTLRSASSQYFLFVFLIHFSWADTYFCVQCQRIRLVNTPSRVNGHLIETFKALGSITTATTIVIIVNHHIYHWPTIIPHTDMLSYIDTPSQTVATALIVPGSSSIIIGTHSRFKSGAAWGDYDIPGMKGALTGLLLQQIACR